MPFKFYAAAAFAVMAYAAFAAILWLNGQLLQLAVQAAQ